MADFDIQMSDIAIYSPLYPTGFHTPWVKCYIPFIKYRSWCVACNTPLSSLCLTQQRDLHNWSRATNVTLTDLTWLFSCLYFFLFLQMPFSFIVLSQKYGHASFFFGFFIPKHSFETVNHYNIFCYNLQNQSNK